MGLSIVSKPEYRYIIVRYFSYFIFFVFNLLLPFKLGSENYGIWAFFMLFVQYFNQLNFGIPTSLNISLSLAGSDKSEEYLLLGKYSFLMLLTSFVYIVLFVFIYFGFKDALMRYRLTDYYIVIVLICLLNFLNQNLLNYCRVRNYYRLMGGVQNAIPFAMILSLLFLFVFPHVKCISFLIFVYFLVSLFVFCFVVYESGVYKKVKLIVHFEVDILLRILRQFVYNFVVQVFPVCNRYIVSVYFSVKSLGLYSFAFNLANAVYLSVDVLTYYLYPSILKKINLIKDDYLICKYIYLKQKMFSFFVFVVMSISIIVIYPFFTYFSEYSKTFDLFVMLLMSLFYFFHFFYKSIFLVLRNKEVVISLIFFSLLVIMFFITYLFYNEMNLRSVSLLLNVLLFISSAAIVFFFYVRYDKGMFKREFFDSTLYMPFIISVSTYFISNIYITCILVLLCCVLNIRILKFFIFNRTKGLKLFV